MTLHGEVRVPGGGGLPDAAYIMAGARAALDFFGDGVALFAEAGYRQNINEVAQRDARVLGGLQFLPFRGVRVTGWYGRELAGGSIAGFIVDVPLGIHGYSLRDLARLTAAVDPFVAGDGWMYSDTCQPLFRIGSPSGLALVHNESRRDSIAVGTHLWRRGGTLYRDQAAREPYMPVLPKVGTPAPVSQSWPFGVSAPWPDFHEARQLPETAQRWLRRFALAPDPDKSGMCAELLEQMIARMEAAERAPTLADRCREVEELAARTLAAAPPDEHRRAAAGAGMAAVLLRAQFCNPKTSGVDLSAALAALRVAVGRPAAPTKSDAPQPAQSALPLGPAQRSVLPPGPPAPSPQMAAHGAQAQGGGAAKPPTRGGTYLLFDEEGRVVRTGRTKDLERRRREHALDGATREYRFEADKHTDDYAEQRGREQIIHDRYRPRLNKIEPISPRNPRRQEYLDAGKKL